MEPIKEIFAKAFNQALDRLGVPALNYGRVVVVARMFDVATATAQKWVSGMQIPDVKRLPEVADRCGATVDQLLRGGQSEGLAAIEVTTHALRTHVHIPRELLVASGLSPSSVRVLRVESDEMEPYVVTGDFVLYEPRKNELRVGVNVVCINERNTVRRVQQLSTGRLLLMCENHRFAPDEVDMQSVNLDQVSPAKGSVSVRIIGPVVGRILLRR